MTTPSPAAVAATNASAEVRTSNMGRWLLVIAVLVVCASVSAFYAINEYSSATSALIKAADANAERFESIYTDAAARRLSKLRLGADMLLESGEIVSAFAKDDREALLKKAIPLYNEVLKKKHDVDRFNFWNPPAKLFLRANEPKAFGIDSSESRQIVVAATKSQSDVFGMEAGAGGVIALRAIVPVMEGTSFVGVIELGSELNTLLQRASKTTGMEYAVGLDVKRSEVVKRPVDAKNDSVQGQDVFYIYSNPAIGKTVRSIAFNPRNTAAQIVRSSRETIFINTFPINDYSGSPSVVVATILDLTEAFADVLHSVLIKGTVAFLLLTVLTFVAIFKFRDLRDGFSRAISQQRLELEEKAAFCEAAAEKLKDVDLLKRGFFTNLIAAINEPLKAVAGTLQSVTQSMEGNRADPSCSPDSAAKQRQERLQFALTETTRLSALVNDYQQIELFRQKLVSSESSLLSVSAVVARTLTEDLAMVQRLPLLKISSDVPQNLPQIRVDEDLMRRALSALVNYAARGAGQGKIAIQGSVNLQGWLKLSITGSAYELAGAPTDSVLDESRQFLSRLATEQGAIETNATLIPIVLARMIVEFYGGTVDASPADTANPGFVVLLPAAV